MANLSWAASTAPWWVTPAVTLTAVWITARATSNREIRSERRKAAVDLRERIYSAFDIERPTGPYTSFTPEERDLELALLDLGFSRFEVAELTRRLYDRRRDPDLSNLLRQPDLTVKRLTLHAERTADWRVTQDVLAQYLLGRISLRKARRQIWGYPSWRRHKRARKWAKSQYRAYPLPTRDAGETEES